MKVSNKHYIAIGIVVLVIIIGFVLYFVYKNKKKKQEEFKENPKEEPKKPIMKPVTKPVINNNNDPFSNLPLGNLPLAYGQKSKMAGILKLALNDIYQANLNKNDGLFDKQTELILIKFYRSKIVDKAIGQKIYSDLQKNKASRQALQMFYNTIVNK